MEDEEVKMCDGSRGRGSQHKAEGDGPTRGAAKGRAALGKPQAGQAATVMQGAPQV